MTTDPTIAALELFQRAHDLHGPARERFLRDQCGPDVALFERVSEMLRADARSHAFLDHALSAEAPRRPPARVEGRQLGPYRLVRELGRGGMGVVYLAERDDVGRRVALKLITGHSASAEGIARFHYERRVLASLEHPYIARFLDAGIAEDETPWLAMEYVEGQALDAWCRTRELPVADRVALVEKVCEAVAYVHRNLLVHRDLKPSNILITGEGEPRLVDFGIAKLLADEVPGQRTLPEAAGRPMTPEYASPEQLRGDRITPASDVYQLGLVLQELLRDRRIRGDLANILAMALAPEPERRYASADQLREDIRAHREGRPVVARPGSIAYRARKFVQRHKAAVGMLVTLNVVLVASALLLANQARRIARERDRAEQVSTVLERLVRFADPTASGPDSGSARAVLAEAASEARAGLARDSRTWGRILVSIADVYRNAGQNDTAVALLREAVTSLRATVPADDPALLGGVNSLGVMFVMTGAVDSGLALLEQVVTHARRLDPRRREELASHLIDLGFGRQVAGDDRRAFELYAEAMPVLETLPDSGAGIYDRALINLGFMSERAGEDSAAAARFRLALDRRLARHGPESGPTLNAMTSYARAQLRLGNLEEAERWSDRALETRRRMLPDPHQNLAESLLLVSQIHAARNRLALADSTGRLALSMYRRLPAASAMTLGWSLATLAGILSREGKYAEAGGMLREALQAYRSVVGDLHPSTLLTVTSLAENELWLGNPRVALELIERAVPPLDSIWGDRATLAAPLTTWGIALADLGRCAEALPHLERAARLARARWADTSLAVTVPERYLQRCGGRAG